MAIDAYEKAVDHYGKNKIDAEFTNKGPEHASIVVSRIFEYAKYSVKIFTGTLNSQVADSPKYMQALHRYVNSGRPLFVIVEEMPQLVDCSNALKFVIESSNNPLLNVKYKIATPEFIESVSNSFISHNPYHFMIADDSIYRVETEREEFKAICNFNDEKITKRLAKTFDAFFNNEDSK